MSICAAFSAPKCRLIVHLQISCSESSMTGACNAAAAQLNQWAALTGTKWTLQQGANLSHMACMLGLSASYTKQILQD